MGELGGVLDEGGFALGVGHGGLLRSLGVVSVMRSEVIAG